MNEYVKEADDRFKHRCHVARLIRSVTVCDCDAASDLVLSGKSTLRGEGEATTVPRLSPPLILQYPPLDISRKYLFPTIDMEPFTPPFPACPD